MLLKSLSSCIIQVRAVTTVGAGFCQGCGSSLVVFLIWRDPAYFFLSREESKQGLNIFLTLQKWNKHSL